jgi:ribosome biogenesis SPOUT family RNA methylase Rps3
VKIVIEHLEPILSEWIYYEYESSYKIVGDDLLITGIKIPGLPSTPKRFNEVFDPSEVIILDPQADRKLSREDLNKAKAVVIGGILGDHPPKGRTKLLLSDKFPEAMKRNIGKYQFPIDGAVLYTKLLMENKEIKYVFGLQIKCNYRGLENVIELPYAYILICDRPYIYEKLLNYLTRGLKDCRIYFDKEKIFMDIENSVKT